MLMNGHLSATTWKIWIGHYRRGEWMGAWTHNMLTAESEDMPQPSVDGYPVPNTQTTTLVVGKLYIHMFSSTFPWVVWPVNFGKRSEHLLAQIWPVKTRLAWPPPAIITDRDADIFADAIFNALYKTFG